MDNYDKANLLVPSEHENLNELVRPSGAYNRTNQIDGMINYAPQVGMSSEDGQDPFEILRANLNNMQNSYKELKNVLAMSIGPVLGATLQSVLEEFPIEEIEHLQMTVDLQSRKHRSGKQDANRGNVFKTPTLSVPSVFHQSPAMVPSFTGIQFDYNHGQLHPHLESTNAYGDGLLLPGTRGSHYNINPVQIPEQYSSKMTEVHPSSRNSGNPRSSVIEADPEKVNFQEDYNTLKKLCDEEEKSLTFHLRASVVGQNVSDAEIMEATAVQLEKHSPAMAAKLRQAVAEPGAVFLQAERILVVKFMSNADCRAVKETMTKHVRDMYAEGGAVAELYKHVQGFVISCPEQIRRVKRHLKHSAAELEKLTGHRMPLYIGTPILDGCEKRFTPFAKDIKEELIWKAVYAGPEQNRTIKPKPKDVIFCDIEKSIQGKITWLSLEEAVEWVNKRKQRR